MSESFLMWRNSPRAGQQEGSLSHFLDDCMSKVPGSNFYRDQNGWNLGSLRYEVVPLIGVAATSGSAIASFKPGSGAGSIILWCVVNVAKASSGAANLTVGVGSTPTTAATNLITATAVGSTGIIDSISSSITATTAIAIVCPVGSSVNFQGSATTVGLIASALIMYWQY